MKDRITIFLLVFVGFWAGSIFNTLKTEKKENEILKNTVVKASSNCNEQNKCQVCFVAEEENWSICGWAEKSELCKL